MTEGLANVASCSGDAKGGSGEMRATDPLTLNGPVRFVVG